MEKIDTTILRVGLMGCANIAKKQAKTIALPDSRNRITAVASRSQSKVEAFVHDFVKDEQDGNKLMIFSGPSSYDDLLQCDDVDAVYIPLPTTLHKEWVKKTLDAGKHVLLEKPVSVIATDYEDMLDLAKKKNLVLMDGTMFPHHARTRDLVHIIEQGDKVGRVTRVQISFSFLGDDEFFQNDIRCHAWGDPLGCVGDLGWYCVRLALLVFGAASGGHQNLNPTVQAVDWKVNDEGVPLDTTCLVRFGSDRLLTFHCGFMTPFLQSVVIRGDKKTIRVEDFVLPCSSPLEMKLQSMDYSEETALITIDSQTIVADGDAVQELEMWRNFARFCENSKEQQDNRVTEEYKTMQSMSLMNQRIMDAILQSIQQDGKVIKLSAQ